MKLGQELRIAYGIWLVVCIPLNIVCLESSRVTVDGGYPIYELPLDKAIKINLTGNSIAYLQVSGLPVNLYRFLVFQAHSQSHPLRMTYLVPSLATLSSDYVESTSPGLVAMLDDVTESGVYLQNRIPRENATVLVAAKPYSSEDPIPGGCNMEFNTEIAPYLKVSYTSFTTQMMFQHASVGYTHMQPQPSCDWSYDKIVHSVYLYFLSERNLSEELYFDAMSSMMDSNTILSKAQKVELNHGPPSTLVQLVTYRRQGVIFSIIASDVRNSSWSSVYVPIASYGCSFTDPRDSCNDTMTTFECTLAVTAAILGLTLCYLGHRAFQFSMAIHGFLSMSLITYILSAKYSILVADNLAALTLAVGVLGGFCWLCFWWFVSAPVLAVLLPAFNLGFLLACILFYTPLGYIKFLQNDLNFWLFLSYVVLLVAISFIAYTRMLHIVACAVTGSYGAIVLIDRFAGGSLTYIVENVIRRAIVPNFNTVLNIAPFQTNDIILSCLWAVLAATGVGLQWYRERTRSPFPLSPYTLRRILRHLPSPAAPPSNEDERQPLLADRQAIPVNYRSTAALPSNNSI